MSGDIKKENIERSARIFNIQKYNMHDGPGVRTLIFFKGCPLRCKWCANPEGLSKDFQVIYKRKNCIDCGACVPVCPVGIHVMENGEHKVRRDIKCIGCRKCEDTCYKKALAIAGEDKDISDLLNVVNEDREFYNISGGGVTLGGGEVTMQPEAASSLLMACKQDGLNTVIETCGHCRTEDFFKIADSVDLFLFDIKHMDPVRHRELTGVNNELILSNLKALLEGGHRVKIRMPLLKDINDSREEIHAIVSFLTPYKHFKNFQGVDLLPYHKLGVAKYEQLDMDYPIKNDPALSEENLKKIEAWLLEEDFPVNLIRH